jgi:diguanylate cyclase (GGDEF)-like protein
LTHRANHDALTGLYNRAAFAQRLAEIFAKSRVLDRPATLLAIDLDHFKALNDAAGHAAGDAALGKVANICRDKVRASDMVARLGGDEFVILLDNCSGERASVVGQKILAALNPLKIEWRGTSYSIGASFGVAPWNEDMVSEADWTAAADRLVTTPSTPVEDSCGWNRTHARGRLHRCPSTRPSPRACSWRSKIIATGATRQP